MLFFRLNDHQTDSKIKNLILITYDEVIILLLKFYEHNDLLHTILQSIWNPTVQVFQI